MSEILTFVAALMVFAAGVVSLAANVFKRRLLAFEMALVATVGTVALTVAWAFNPDYTTASMLVGAISSIIWAALAYGDWRELKAERSE